MRVGVASVYSPGVRGGAEFLADGLCNALQRAGHCVHRMIHPFSYASIADAVRSMDVWESQDLAPYQGGGIDLMIGLKWPAYLIGHPVATAWLLHQHRPAYDLFDTPFGFSAHDPAALALRARIEAADASAFARMRAVFTISQRVSDRLAASLGKTSTPLYHPPDSAEQFWNAPSAPFILVPSRLESLKRQDLLLDGLAQCRQAVNAVIVGEGGMRSELMERAERLGLTDQVKFVGSVSRHHLISLYAHATGVFFGPRDEDYGYVTLEAMLAGKPVITCSDSGGPLEFVVDGETGFVTAPRAEAVADAIEKLFADPRRAVDMGRAGRLRYDDLVTSWDEVVDRLTRAGAAMPAYSRDAAGEEPDAPSQRAATDRVAQ